MRASVGQNLFYLHHGYLVRSENSSTWHSQQPFGLRSRAEHPDRRRERMEAAFGSLIK